MSVLRRIYLFARDYCSEFGCAWSIARTNDCERNGGHRWGEYHGIGPERMRECSRCRCSQSPPATGLYPFTTATTGSTANIVIFPCA